MSNVLFCKTCGGHVPESDLTRGKGRRLENGAICLDCLEEQSDVQPQQIQNNQASNQAPPLFNRPKANSNPIQDEPNSLPHSNPNEDQFSSRQEQELIEEIGLMNNGGYPEDTEEESAAYEEPRSRRSNSSRSTKGRSSRNKRASSRRGAGGDRKTAEPNDRDRRSKRQAGASRRMNASPAARGTSRRQAKEPATRGNSRRASTRGSTRQSTRGARGDRNEREANSNDRNSRRGGRPDSGQDNNQMIIIGSVVAVLAIVGMFFMFSGDAQKPTRKKSYGTGASALVQRARAKENSGDKLGAADLYNEAAEAFSKAGDETTAQRYSMKAYGLRKHSTLNLNH